MGFRAHILENKMISVSYYVFFDLIFHNLSGGSIALSPFSGWMAAMCARARCGTLSLVRSHIDCTRSPSDAARRVSRSTAQRERDSRQGRDSRLLATARFSRAVGCVETRRSAAARKSPLHNSSVRQFDNRECESSDAQHERPTAGGGVCRFNAAIPACTRVSPSIWSANASRRRRAFLLPKSRDFS